MEEAEQRFADIYKRIESIMSDDGSKNVKLQRICQLMADGVDHYDWVGFYLVDTQNPRELVLGPYVGEPTDHVQIGFGQGICGQAAQLERTFMIQDVRKEDNYLSCSIDVRSEIVVPIFKGNEIAGELDIDSHTESPFTEKERIWLEKMCELISELL